MSQLLDNETEQALEAAANNADAMAEAVKAKPAKGRSVNHAARCRKAWNAFQAAAKDAMSAGVKVEIALHIEEEEDNTLPKGEPSAPADCSSVYITAIY